MGSLIGITAGEARQIPSKKPMVFQITGGEKSTRFRDDLRIIRVINYPEKIECVLADPCYPQDKTPSSGGG